MLFHSTVEIFEIRIGILGRIESACVFFVRPGKGKSAKREVIGCLTIPAVRVYISSL